MFFILKYPYIVETDLGTVPNIGLSVCEHHQNVGHSVSVSVCLGERLLTGVFQRQMCACASMVTMDKQRHYVVEGLIVFRYKLVKDDNIFLNIRFQKFKNTFKA